MQMTKDNGEKLITVHPNSGSNVQPPVFGHFETYFNIVATEFPMSPGHAGKAFPFAFTANNNNKGFSSTGFHPFK